MVEPFIGPPKYGGLEAINLEAGDYLASDGVIYPIIDYADANGERCEWFNAVWLIAYGGDKFYVLERAAFNKRGN